MLDLAQAMRDLNTRTVATYTIDSYPKRIGELSVLIPQIKSESMKQVLEIFQGRAPLTAQKASIRTTNKPTFVLVAQRIAIATTTTLAISETTTTPTTPTTTIPNSTVLQKTVGVVPPDDPTCR
jgi:hypothetical protein